MSISVCVIGDSHVGRIALHGETIRRSLGPRVSVSFRYRGGSGFNFIRESMGSLWEYDIVLVFTGGNDLKPGLDCEAAASSASSLLLELGTRGLVAYLPVWPRHRHRYPEFSAAYDRMRREFEEALVSCCGSAIRFWEWGYRRMRVHHALEEGDRVHLSSLGYSRAAKDLVCLINKLVKQ